MKDFTLIAWLSQLGLSVVLPLAGFILSAIWLRQRFSLGSWILWVGIALGFISAFDGFRTSLKALARLSDSGSNQEPPPVSFNDHD